tara:strand:+ start:1265 stop:2152 length:888 start_codon:yes stop_codon:yes gene_type:complete
VGPRESGSTVTNLHNTKARVLPRALLFVSGFSLVFALAGTSAGLAGRLLQDAQTWINPLAGILLLLLGIHTTGIPRIIALRLAKQAGTNKRNFIAILFIGSVQALYRNVQVEYRIRRYNPISSVVVGIAFALSWTPCVGFILGGILTAAFNANNSLTAFFLLLSYSLGLGVPFVILAVLVDRTEHIVRKLSRHSQVISIASGVILASFGAMVLADSTEQLARFLGTLPLIDDSFLAQQRESGLGIGWVIPSFIAGTISFLSPCVLPLVPVYLAHLAGSIINNDHNKVPMSKQLNT